MVKRITLEDKVKRTTIDCLLISLRARKKRASGYVYNTPMQLEVKLLSAQIKALETELKED